MKKGLLIAASNIAILSGMVASYAYAQEPAVEEVVVTAQRREESLQQTPVAVTALSGASLERRQVDTLDKIALYTPNIRFDSSAAVSGGKYIATTFIRGIGQNDYAINTDPGVGTFVDGVYYARAVGGILDGLDLERVEVLRGPQGTLFGKNTIGGAVQIVTKKPESGFRGRAEAVTGSFNRADLKAFVNLPLIDDKLYTRLSVLSVNRDGFQHRILDEFDQVKLGDRNAESARLQVRWLPSADVTVDLAADYTRARENSANSSVLGIAPQPGLSGVPFLTTYNTVVAPTMNIVAPNGQRTLNSSFITGDPDQTYATGANGNDLDLWGVSGTVDWDLGAFNLKSISAYRHLNALFARDGDGTPYQYREGIFDVWQRQVSQELQASHQGEKVFWLVGLYYFDEKGLDDGFTNIANFSPVSVVQHNDLRFRSTSFAVFAQGTYELTDQLSFTAGARLNKDRKRMNVINTAFNGSFAGTVRQQIAGERKASWTSFTPLARVQYAPSDTLMMYASYSQGFKSGSFNARATRSADEFTQYEPEEAASYEMGLKSSWLDRRLTANFAAFYTDYTEIQQSVIQTPAVFVANAAKARIKGFEVELVAALSSAVQANFAVGHTDARFTKLGAGLGAGQILPITRDTRFVKTPKWTVSGGMQFTQELRDLGTLLWRGDAAYYSAYANDIANTPKLNQPGYATVDGSVTFNPASQPWRVTLFVKNLTDKRYLVSGNSSPSIGIIEGTYNSPREWGLSAAVDF